VKKLQAAAPSLASNDAPKPKAKRASLQDSGVGQHDGARFVRVRAAILQGEIKPTQRDIWNAVQASQRVAARYLAEMEAAGELKREGKRFVVVGVA
jgi:fructose-bisphosphate aldolase class 1